MTAAAIRSDAAAGEELLAEVGAEAWYSTRRG